jgi:NDP-hexose 2,3-enoyl reductase
VSEQSIYNLMTRHIELEVIPAAQHYGIGIIPWSPLNGGLLGGAIRKLAEGGAGRAKEGRSADALAEHRATVEAYEAFCADLGHDPANVALGWLLSRPGVTAPIIGPRTVAQLDASLGALDVQLDESALARLDELFPPIGNGGPGPEAWAW